MIRKIQNSSEKIITDNFFLLFTVEFLVLLFGHDVRKDILTQIHNNDGRMSCSVTFWIEKTKTVMRNYQIINWEWIKRDKTLKWYERANLWSRFQYITAWLKYLQNICFPLLKLKRFNWYENFIWIYFVQIMPYNWQLPRLKYGI